MQNIAAESEYVRVRLGLLTGLFSVFAPHSTVSDPNPYSNRTC